MRQIRQLGLALIVVAATGVVAASAAWAEETGNPEILPIPTAVSPLSFTVSSVAGSEPLLVSTANLKLLCEEVKGEGSFTSRRLGTALLNFGKNCLEAGVKCKAEADVTGTILMKADVHFVDVLPVVDELRLGLKVAPTTMPFVITCGVVKLEVRGSTIGLTLVGKSLEKTKHFEVHFTQSSLGEQTLKTCDLDKEICEPEGKGKSFLTEESGGKGLELAAWVLLVLILTATEIEPHY
jgi:hypothetical protein